MRNSFLLLASLATASQAGVPNVFRPNDPARSAAVNANFRYLDSAVGTKADTSALNTVRASIPAGVNIGGKVDTAALTARLAGYVPTSTLADYAKTTALSSYATTAVVNGKMNTADYVASGHLKALGGLTGGRGISGSFMGSSLVLDTSELRMVNAGNFTLLNNTSLVWRKEYTGWELGTTDAFKIIRNTRSFDITAMILTDFKAEFPNNVAIGGEFTTSGTAQFAGDVKIDGALTLKSAATVVPDYVFESDYKLAPLAEVEAFTQANKHLPDVPSAKDIEAGGMDLAKMNLVLLKKVEELTLHAIAQEKQIKAQNERIQSLESRLAN